MESLEISGKTVDEAVRKALEQFGVNREQVTVEVLKKGKAGILGLGSEEAKVRVSLVNEPGAVNREDIVKMSKEMLLRVLTLMGLEATLEEVVTVEEKGDPDAISLNIEGKDLGVLIGRSGQTLFALQHLLRLMVARNLKKTVPLNIDVQSYKVRREKQLTALALRLAEQVKNSGRSETMEPMPSNERRIVHLALANIPEVSTQSIGSGEERKVVIVSKERFSGKKVKEENPGEGGAGTNQV